MIYLYGASGHAKVIIEIAEHNGFTIGGLIDANPAIKSLLGYPVSTSIPEDVQTGLGYVISIGKNLTRKKIAAQLEGNFFETLVHHHATLSNRCRVGVGTVIMAGVSINSGVSIGEHCIINTNASVDHDCVLEDYVHISPNVALAGEVHVGEGTHIGIGACVIQGVKIGKWCTIGAGAVIIRDVPDGATVVGNPGRIIKTNS